MRRYFVISFYIIFIFVPPLRPRTEFELQSGQHRVYSTAINPAIHSHRNNHCINTGQHTYEKSGGWGKWRESSRATGSALPVPSFLG